MCRAAPRTRLLIKATVSRSSGNWLTPGKTSSIITTYTDKRNKQMILVHGTDDFEYYVNEKLITSICAYKNGSFINFDKDNFVQVRETASQVLKLISS
jgi:hypothetical protein